MLELFELCGCFLEGTNALVGLGEAIAWLFSTPNRTARREAKKTGHEVPPRDGWTWAFLILLPIFVLLTGLILVKYIRR